MKRNTLVFSIIISAVVGLVLAFLWALICTPSLRNVPLWLLALTGITVGGIVGGTFVFFRYIRRDIEYNLEHLPASAADYIKLVIKYMRYRKIARQEVADELTDHFEQGLKDCKTEQQKQQQARHLIDNFGDPKLLAVLLRRAKKRCRPLWRTIAARTFQATALLLICLVLYIVWFLTSKPVITKDYIAELNKLARPSADDSLNAAPLYQKAIDSLVDMNNFNKFLRIDFQDANDKQKELIRQWLAKNQTSLELVTEGTNLPYFWKHYRSEDPNQGAMSIMRPDLSISRKICYALCWQIWLSAEDGDIDSALRDIETCYRFGRHNKSEKTLVEQLVGMAIQRCTLDTARLLLDTYKIDSETLTDFQRRLQQLIDKDDFRINLQLEMLGVYDVIQRCIVESSFGPSRIYIKHISETSNTTPPTDWWSYLPSSAEDWRFLTQVLFIHPDKTETIALANSYFEFIDEIATKTPAQLQAEDIDLDSETHRLIGNIFILNIFAPEISGLHMINWINKIDTDSTLLIIALIRYRQDTGSYPATLADIVKNGYLEKIPVDPFSGNSIAYRKTNNDFLLYSYGEDLDDDSGEVSRNEKGKIINWPSEGDYIFWPIYKNE